MSSSFPGHQNYNQSDGIFRGVYASNPESPVTINTAGPAPLTAKDAYLIMLGGASSQLPLLLQVGQGHELTIANRAGGFVVVQVDAQDTAAGRGIEGAGGDLTLYDGDTVTLKRVAEPNGGPANIFWRVISFSKARVASATPSYANIRDLSDAGFAVDVPIAAAWVTVLPFAAGAQDANAIAAQNAALGTITTDGSGGAGTYKVHFEAQVEAFTFADTVNVRLTGSLLGVIGTHEFLSNATNDPEQISFSAIVALGVGEVILAEVTSDFDGDDITFKNASITVERLSA